MPTMLRNERNWRGGLVAQLWMTSGARPPLWHVASDVRRQPSVCGLLGSCVGLLQGAWADGAFEEGPSVGPSCAWACRFQRHSVAVGRRADRIVAHAYVRDGSCACGRWPWASQVSPGAAERHHADRGTARMDGRIHGTNRRTAENTHVSAVSLDIAICRRI